MDKDKKSIINQIADQLGLTPLDKEIDDEIFATDNEPPAGRDTPLNKKINSESIRRNLKTYYEAGIISLNVYQMALASLGNAEDE